MQKRFPLSLATLGLGLTCWALCAAGCPARPNSSLPLRGFLAGAATPAPAPGGAAAELAFERSKFMQDTAYHDTTKMALDYSPDGAYSETNRAYDLDHSSKWYIEEQRTGADAIAGGLSKDDTAAIDRGLLLFKWGFAQQASDGSFPGTAGGQDWQEFHSTSFFVEAVARACLLLQASKYADKYAGQINALKPKLLKAALWMTTPDVERDGKKHNDPTTHRFYLVGCAFGETGVLCGNDDLIKRSAGYVRTGIGRQDPSGFNPEKGGPDTSYNAAGLVFAQRYYTMVGSAAARVSGDSRLLPDLYAMIGRGVAWEAYQIDPDSGQVSQAFNTRVGGKHTENDRGGKPKKLAKGQVYRCLAYWAQLSGDQSNMDLAMRVARGRSL